MEVKKKKKFKWSRFLAD